MVRCSMFQKIQSLSEYDVLKKVVLCSPEFMRIEEVINRIQRKYVRENIDAGLAVKQHNELLKALRDNDIEVCLLEPHKEFPEQVFTRDIGFAAGDRFFVSNMNKEIRSGETGLLASWLEGMKIPFVQLRQGCIEGGDVIIESDNIWVGISDRTSYEVIEELSAKCPGYKVHPIHFDKGYLHLDCTFNIISPHEALIFPGAFSKEEYEKLAGYYDLIKVTEVEQFTLGTNVLPIGKGRLISLPRNRDTNEKLVKRGFTIIEVDISEIIKSGGSFRCVTLPLLRT